MLLALILVFSHFIKRKISKKKAKSHKKLQPQKSEKSEKPQKSEKLEKANSLNREMINFSNLCYRSCCRCNVDYLPETTDGSDSINNNQPEEPKPNANQPEESKVVVLPPPRITQIPQKNKTSN